jgi:GNAT superfamily N-acetyltransferase
VLPDARRLGVASQLMDAQHAWVRAHEYEMIRLECYNQFRGMIILAVKRGYDVVGVRWDAHMSGNLVIFEKNLHLSDD